MTNERKQYLKDANVSIPKRTKYYYKNKQESSQLSQASPSNRINNNYNNDNNLINENDVIEQSSQVSAEIELSNDQIQRIMRKLKLSDLKIKQSNNNNLLDIYDGEIYKNLLKSEDGDLCKEQEAFSFTINTDGCSFTNKSKLTLWPVYLVINELPLDIRFSIDNVIIAGN